jgi:AhpD family alkylhydroperoxidase
MTQRLNPLTAAPDGIAALQAVEKYVHGSGIELKLLALIKVRASQMNGCEYCLHLHTEEARRAGETETRLYLLNAWRESQLYSPRERAALEWTEALTNIAEMRAPDSAWALLRDQFDEKEAIALSIGIAMINAWNRLAIGARITHPHDLARAA